MNIIWNISLTMPQNPGLEIPIPSSGHELELSQFTSIFNAILLCSKHEVWSVDTCIDDSSPIIVQGPIFDGTFFPPASKPENSRF